MSRTLSASPRPSRGEVCRLGIAGGWAGPDLPIIFPAARLYLKRDQHLKARTLKFLAEWRDHASHCTRNTLPYDGSVGSELALPHSASHRAIVNAKYRTSGPINNLPCRRDRCTSALIIR